MKIFELPYLDPANLAGYEEDRKAAKRFERRFRLPSLPGILLIFGTPVAYYMRKIPVDWVFPSIGLGFVILIGTMTWMFKSTPISSNGRPMKKYWSSKPKAGNTEAIYVCEESKTYFIRVWGRPSGDFSTRD